MHIENYKTMAYNILSVNDFYEHLEKDPDRTYITVYLKLIDRYKDILIEKEKNYLLQFE